MAFVCVHTAASLRDGVARGFVWCRDENGCINAYCRDCATELDRFGGEWNALSEAFADFQLLCEHCASKAARLNEISVTPQ